MKAAAPYVAMVMPALELFAEGVKAEGLTPPPEAKLKSSAHVYGLLLYKYDAAVGIELTAIVTTLGLVTPIVVEYLERERQRAEKSADPAPEAKAA